MNLDFDNPEVQANLFYAVAEVCEQVGLPIAANFLQVQGHKASEEHEVQQQDKILVALETKSLLLLEHKVA